MANHYIGYTYFASSVRRDVAMVLQWMTPALKYVIPGAILIALMWYYFPFLSQALFEILFPAIKALGVFAIFLLLVVVGLRQIGKISN